MVAARTVPPGETATVQFDSLLRLRVTPPAVPPGFVSRPRLANKLTAAAARPVTLISAGPGYGKTLTVASWVNNDSAPGRVAWLSVNETDNDLQAFWSDVLGALTMPVPYPRAADCWMSYRALASPTGKLD